ncbi:MAG: carbohydrate ABC transporter permease [Thermomicrobiales bacterium]
MLNQMVQPRRAPRLSLKRREAVSGYLFILPAVLGFVLWFAGPMAYSAWISMTEWDMLSPPRGVGLGNYRAMLDDDLFWTSLRVTFYYVAVSVPLIQLLSFAIALLLNVKVRGLAVFRTIYYLPTIAPVIASSLLWAWIFNSEFGLLNSVITRVGLPKVLWLQDTRWALPTLILLAAWGFGGTMVIYLAGLQGIPQTLYEAAAIDGARAWHRLIHITVPMMGPVIFFNSLLGVIFALQTFTQGFIITNGGPQNSTLFYALYLYRQAFTNFRMGYAAALAWVLFAIVLVLSLIVFRTAGRRVYYEDEGA